MDGWINLGDIFACKIKWKMRGDKRSKTEAVGYSVLVIGVTTFLFSVLGVKIGNVFGSKFEKSAQIIGGIILILIGLKILLEHLGFLAF